MKAILLVAFLGVAAYATYEEMIPMRDGVKLHTLIDFGELIPSNVSCLVDRSPYGANKTELFAELGLLLGWGAVRQDLRGSGQSEGVFDIWRDEDLDIVDTWNWLTSQSWSSGRVYQIGASADGMASFAAGYMPPKQMAGQMIIFATAKGHPILFPGGAFRKSLCEFWMQKTFPNEWQSLVTQIKAQEAPGPWWNPLNLTDFSGIHWPSVHLAGWYDIFLWGQLKAFEGFQTQTAPAVRGKSYMVVDPIGHCQKAHTYFPKDTIVGRTILPFLLAFDVFEGKQRVAENVSAITWYVMSSTDAPAGQGNYWTTANQFPTYTPLSYYIQGDGSLAPSTPSSSALSTSFVYDPSNPVPSIGGNNLELSCGPLDQRPVETRPDVLLFTSAPLTQALALTGPISVTLYVSSNCTDTDFTAKLTDVYPTGESNVIQDGIVRMRWREYLTPQPMVPGTVYKVEVDLWSTSYVFTPGHRLRLAISSSNYPRFSANPNNGLPVSVNGTALIAQNTLYHSAQYPSAINLPFVSLSQMPAIEILATARTAFEKHAQVELTEDVLARWDEMLTRF